MTKLANYGETSILNSVYRNTALPAVASGLFLRLYSDSVAEDGTGTELTDVNYVAATKTLSFGTPATKQCANDAAAYDFFTAAGAVTVTSVALWDAATGGNCWFIDDLPAPVVLSTSEVFEISPNDHIVGLSVGASNLTEAIANAILDHICNNAAFTQPAGLVESIHTADPGNTGTSQLGAEKLAVTFNAPALGLSQAAADVNFAAQTGTVTHVGYWDAGTPTTFVGGSAAVASTTLTAEPLRITAANNRVRVD